MIPKTALWQLILGSVIFDPNSLVLFNPELQLKDIESAIKDKLRERRQLGFVTLNGNLAVNLKPTLPPLLNGKS